MDSPRSCLKEANSNAIRNPSILMALDPVHRSLLLKNLQFEDNPNNNYLERKENQIGHVDEKVIIQNNHTNEQNNNETLEIFKHLRIQSETDEFSDNSDTSLVRYSKMSSPKTKITIKITTRQSKSPLKSVRPACPLPSHSENVENIKNTESSEREIEISSTDSVDPASTTFEDCDESVENEEFHDCNSSVSFYEDTTDKSVELKEETEDKPSDKPLINIVQELNSDMTVTSIVSVNKAKMKHRKTLSAEKSVKTSKKSRQKIIDDNFCNEILDQTFLFGKLHGLDEKEVEKEEDESPLETSFDDDCSFSSGKLEQKPKYSGKSVGKLMAKRMKRIHKNKLNNSEENSDSSNYLNGPTKPPRTFASSSNASKVGSGHSDSTAELKPSCPTLDEIENFNSKLGWNFRREEKTHQIGWSVPKEKQNESIPQDILDMLHYSKDDVRRKQILTSNSIPGPQMNLEMGPKLDIDTVDGIRTPRKSLDSIHFDKFVANSKIGSTPHKKFQCRRSEGFALNRNVDEKEEKRRTSMNDFLTSERQTSFLGVGRRSDHDPKQNHELCNNCKLKIKKSFRKTAVRRTKSFFEASKKKIHLQKLKQQKVKSDKFETPQKDVNINKDNSNNKKFHKHLGYTPDNLKCNTCDESGIANLKKNTEKFKPARLSLNFSDEIVNSPPKADHKFLKTLKNLKISPKKIFKTSENNKKRESGNYKSYSNLNQDTASVVQMGEFLNNIREVVENDVKNRQQISFNNHVKPVEKNRIRKISTSSEFLDRPQERVIAIDLHEEPIYAEISPKNIKTVINNNRYMMVNNNPNAIYATINKSDRKKTNNNIIKSKSLNNIEQCEEILIKKTSNTTTQHHPNISRPLFKDSNVPSLQDCQLSSQDIVDDIRKIDDKLLKSSVNTYRKGSEFDIFQLNNSEEMLQDLSSYDQDKFLRTALGEDHVDRSSFNFIDTDEEIESLQKYQDKEIEDLVTDLKENFTLSEIATDTEFEDVGYDTVGFSLLSRTQTINAQELNDLERNLTNITDLTNNNESALSSPLSSPSSGKFKNQTTEVYRNIKDKLRTSFRKSKKFLKNDLRKVGNSEKNTTNIPFNLEEYKKNYEDRKGDEIYQTLSASFVELSNDYLAELINQIKTQTDVRKQIKQALGICRSTREFECSTELIEAERLLLLSVLKEKAAKTELSRIDYENNGCTKRNVKKVGSVTLNNFEFPLKDDVIFDAFFNYFYIVVCTYKNQVKSTISKEKYEDHVYFSNNEIQFHNLDADYEIRVEVFVLRLRKNVRNYSHESKYHLNKFPESKNFLVQCPSPPKLSSPGKLFATKSASPKRSDFDNEFSRYKSQGFVTLTSFSLVPSNSMNDSNLSGNHKNSPYYSSSSSFHQAVHKFGDHEVHNIEDCKTFNLDSMEYNSNLLGSITISVKSEIKFENSDLSGFLTVGESLAGCKSWNRRWCRINGFVMDFWNYPQENQQKPPILKIDLTKCVSDEISLADRSICSRSKTFSVEIFNSNHDDNDNRNEGNNVKVYLLAADNQNDLKSWMNELNRIVKFLQEWRI